jgi:hypothetical protein
MKRPLIAIAAVVLISACASGTDQQPGLSVRPVEFSTRQWDAALGGDGGVDLTRLEGLSDLPDAPAALAVARAVAQADLSGTGREAYGAHFADTPPAACSGVTLAAASAFSIGEAGAVRYAKALIAWSGSCAVAPPSPAILDVYLADDGSGWKPVHAGSIPQEPEVAGAAEVPAWALSALECSDGAQARVEVAMAWKTMCEQAAADGVTLRAEEGYRSASEQEQRFADAVEFYGSQEEARRHVAPVEGSCSSRHCAGEALDVRMDAAASSWLRAVVGCRRVGGSMVEAASCRPDERAVLQMERYGFAEPRTTAPGHLEFSIALESLQQDACADAPSAQIPALVVSVFRCVARVLGPVPAELIKEALVVSECSSSWNPAAEQFDGKYATRPNPTTNRLYEGQGLFGLPPRVVSQLVAGGDALDPWQNATAAARLYVREVQRGRQGWGFNVCATGDAAVTAVLGAPWPAWISMWVK